jgi:uncharacterized membrane protein
MQNDERKYSMNSPRSFFLITSLVWGVCYALLVPPFQAPDETSHFYRTVHVAQGNLMGESTPDMRLGGELPGGVPKLYEPFARLRYNFDEKVNGANFRAARATRLQSDSLVFVDFANVGYYSPFPYLLQAAVMRAMLFFQTKPLWLLYAGRLTTLFIWIVLVGWALRLLPFHRWTFAFLALLPSSLFLHASLSGDVLTHGLCFWLTAALLSLIFAKNETQKYVKPAVFLAAGIVVLSKPVYFPLVFLAFLVPQVWYTWGNRHQLFAAGLCLWALALLAWWYGVAGDNFIPYDRYHPAYRDGQQLNEGVQPHAQLAGVLAQPLRFLKIMAISYAESAQATLAHYFGKFGWEKNYLPGWLIGLLAIAAAIAAASERRFEGLPDTKHRIVFAGLALSMMVAIAMVIYMQWTPLGAGRILALNGRYFIPVFPLFFLCLTGFGKKIPQNLVVNFAKIALLFSLAWGAWEVICRYYLML